MSQTGVPLRTFPSHGDVERSYRLVEGCGAAAGREIGYTSEAIYFRMAAGGRGLLRSFRDVWIKTKYQKSSPSPV